MGVRILTATVLLGACLALPAQAGNPRPRVLDPAFPAALAPLTMADLTFAGRDRNGVVRGYDVDFGDGARSAISHCEVPRRGRRFKREPFSIAYAYMHPGTYTITIRVLSGGCGEPRQRSLPSTLSVVVG